MQEPQFNYNEILTEEEKAYHLAYAIEQNKKHYAKNLLLKGESPQSVELKVLQVEWEQTINKDEVLKFAAIRKIRHEDELKRKQAREQQEILKAAEIRAKWTKERLKETIESHYNKKFQEGKAAKPFQKIEWQEEYIETLCDFIVNPTNRGLLISGDPGLGKTETIKAIASNELRPFKIYSMHEIADNVKSYGEFNLSSRNVVLDDVGSETCPVKYFGTDINWFQEFIETTDLNREDFSNLIITTNLDGDGIERIYGQRVRSRIRKMFKVVVINGKDMRA